MSIKSIIAVTLCLSVFVKVSECNCVAEDRNTSKPLSAHDRIYFLQHRLLPKWTYESEGAFLDDLMHDRTNRLSRAAQEVVGEEFSRRIKIRKYAESNGILLIFAEPVEAPECFFIYIEKTQSGFRFYTYEKTIDLFGTGEKGIVGEWSIDKKHYNLGPRKYEDEDSFVSELQKTRELVCRSEESPAPHSYVSGLRFAPPIL